MWAEGGWTGPTYRVAYAISDSPLGPFERRETILQQNPLVATGAGHHRSKALLLGSFRALSNYPIYPFENSKEAAHAGTRMNLFPHRLLFHYPGD